MRGVPHYYWVNEWVKNMSKILMWHCGKVGGNITTWEGQKSQLLTQPSLTVVWEWGTSTHLGEGESLNSWSDCCRFEWDEVFLWCLTGEEGLSKTFLCYYESPLLVHWIKTQEGEGGFFVCAHFQVAASSLGYIRQTEILEKSPCIVPQEKARGHSAFFSIYQSPPMIVCT